VVHRGRALAFPIPSLRLEVAESKEPGALVNGERQSDEIWQKLQELRTLCGLSGSNASPGLEIRSAVPLAAGLGSSAALCVAMARLTAARLDQTMEGEALAELALKGEALFHGKPSGVDPWTVALEKPLLFRSSDRSYRLLQLEAFYSAKLAFVLESSGEPHCTKEVIETVSELKARTPLIWDDLLDALATNAEAMARALEEQPLQLGRLLNDTHFRLQQLGVSNAPLDTVVQRLREAGALGAKLTGAGRGGFVVGLFRQDQADAYLATPATNTRFVWKPT